MGSIEALSRNDTTFDMPTKMKTTAPMIGRGYKSVLRRRNRFLDHALADAAFELRPDRFHLLGENGFFLF
jgi:hypothetical protein